MSNKVIHVSNTDIRSDFRIIRQIKALQDYDVIAIGIEDKSEPHKFNLDGYCKYIILKSFSAKFVTKSIRHFFNLIYFNIQAFLLFKSCKPSLIHVHDTYPLFSAIAYKKLYGCKVVYDCHELESNKGGQSKALARLTYFIESLCYRHCDSLITVSSLIEKWYIDTFLELPYHELIYNSPEFKQNLASKTFSDTNSNKFVYVGQFSEGRNLIELLDIFQDNGQECHFIGWGVLEDRIIESSKGFKNIHYHKPMPNDLLMEFLNENDFTFGLCILAPISLSDKYSLPNKLFEYTFSGFNVIGSDFPEIASYIKNTNSGYTFKNIEEFKVLLNTGGLIRKNINHEELDGYSWSQMIVKLRRLYSNLL
ncbi:glycosyltransferase [Pseudoalteromonas rhizosphaerae]|uniref:glycosyltransferase n=1 Tax=Pseudoalteromonas rhizosphaerae TaxID=2518973 RepID=UPI002147FA7B|nr:glycosyltransferase [Pseudoalteromonas rhizosphaerae]